MGMASIRKVLLDNGHGVETAGKRSPDGRLLEYKYAREIAGAVKDGLLAKGYDAECIVPEEEDISLSERCRRVNAICDELGKSSVLLVSVHCNAAGDGSGWMSAHGWSAYVSNNASVASKQFARCLIQAAKAAGLSVREYSHQVPYWTQNLAICRDTKCPAVLTENLFQDNEGDVEYLLSDEGRRVITELHVNGIMAYMAQ